MIDPMLKGFMIMALLLASGIGMLGIVILFMVKENIKADD